MRPIRCLAVDDEPMALKKLEQYISRTPYLELAALCESPFEAMRLIAEDKIDAIFADIRMPDMNGMDLIASLAHPPMVIFTTAYAEYAVESYRLSAVDYLLKPFDFVDFQRAANKLLSAFMQSQPRSAHDDRLLVKEGYKYVNIAIDDILYAEAMSDYVCVHLRESRTVIASISLKQLRERLPEYFLQIHRSYIVNMRRISEIERACIIIDKNTRLPVGENFRPEFQDYLRLHSLAKNIQSKQSEE